MVSSDQPCHRGALMVAIEGGRWIVTLTGYGEQVPPQDMAGFIAYARSLPAHRIGDLVSRAKPLDEGCVFQFPASLRRHWERLAHLPDGFVVVGDSLCSLNPVFGHGMTVAAQESQAPAAALAGPQAGWPGGSIGQQHVWWTGPGRSRPEWISSTLMQSGAAAC